jgi:transcriptional regulator with XRE-family HTH domain
MLLRDYRKTVAKLSRAKAGEAIGVDQITVWRWENGRSIPMPEQMRKVQAWSGGQVTPNDFVSGKPAVITGAR